MHIPIRALQLLLVTSVVLMGLSARSDAAPARSPGRRVLIVSVDGLRPDLLLRADAPVLRGLLRRGAFTMWAQTTAVSVTLPSHVSMLTGVSPDAHGVSWNSDLPLARPVYPKSPTLFDLATRAGFTTAMVAGKSKFSALARPGSLRWAFVPSTSVVTDPAVTDTAVRWIARHAPEVMFVHLPGVDGVGHASGWGSDAQLAQINVADSCIGVMLAALERRGLVDSTCVIVSSDHGGAGRSHGPDDARSRHIPWIVAGPGVRRNLDLTLDASLTVHTEDTFGTACALLGLAPPAGVSGRLVEQVLEAGAEVARPR